MGAPTGAELWERLPKNTAAGSEVDHRGERIICLRGTGWSKSAQRRSWRQCFSFGMARKIEVRHDPSATSSQTGACRTVAEENIADD